MKTVEHHLKVSAATFCSTDDDDDDGTCEAGRKEKHPENLVEHDG